MLTPVERRDPQVFAELIRIIETSPAATSQAAARALEVVRDGVITGEGPTAAGRIHFSRALDAVDVDWCARILAAPTMDGLAVTRAEAEALIAIDEAATERSDEGRFDGLFARAIVHHAAAASGLPVPPRAVALSPDVAIESWAPTRAVGVDTEVLEWISGQMRAQRRGSVTLHAVVATLIGAATIPFAQAMSSMIDFSM
ncbi:MAG: hypothetical protein EPO23_04850 [Xanthobacteraceae bacterium]|nr:MAG: hypothetical protein EPO23_04850 [Xanthobacteraceae bacterium]